MYVCMYVLVCMRVFMCSRSRCVFVCMCVSMRANVHISVCVYYIYIYTHTHIHMHMCMYACTKTHKCTTCVFFCVFSMRKCVDMHMYKPHTHACKHAHVQACILSVHTPRTEHANIKIARMYHAAGICMLERSHSY